MNKSGFLTGLIVVGVLLVAGFFWFVGEVDEGVVEEGEKCVAASCCHASECVWESDAPDCGEIACTMSCEPGTMDCGQGRCETIKGECEVVWDG